MYCAWSWGIFCWVEWNLQSEGVTNGEADVRCDVLQLCHTCSCNFLLPMPMDLSNFAPESWQTDACYSSATWFGVPKINSAELSKTIKRWVSSHFSGNSSCRTLRYKWDPFSNHSNEAICWDQCCSQGMHPTDWHHQFLGIFKAFPRQVLAKKSTNQIERNFGTLGSHF